MFPQHRAPAPGEPSLSSAVPEHRPTPPQPKPGSLGKKLGCLRSQSTVAASEQPCGGSAPPAPVALDAGSRAGATRWGCSQAQRLQQGAGGLDGTGRAAWRRPCLRGQGPGPAPQPGDMGQWQTPERADTVKPLVANQPQGTSCIWLQAEKQSVGCCVMCAGGLAALWAAADRAPSPCSGAGARGVRAAGLVFSMGQEPSDGNLFIVFLFSLAARSRQQLAEPVLLCDAALVPCPGAPDLVLMVVTRGDAGPGGNMPKAMGEEPA